jgi:hypothetical protein
MAKVLATMVNHAASLMLNVYILLVNQLSPEYATHRVRGWGLVAHWQLASTTFAVYSVSAALSGAIIQDPWSAVKKLIAIVSVLFDTLASVLRVALFVAGLRAWLALALAIWAVATVKLSVYLGVISPRNSLKQCEKFSLLRQLIFTSLFGIISPCFIVNVVAATAAMQTQSPSLTHQRARLIISVW